MKEGKKKFNLWSFLWGSDDIYTIENLDTRNMRSMRNMSAVVAVVETLMLIVLIVGTGSALNRRLSITNALIIIGASVITYFASKHYLKSEEKSHALASATLGFSMLCIFAVAMIIGIYNAMLGRQVIMYFLVTFAYVSIFTMRPVISVIFYVLVHFIFYVLLARAGQLPDLVIENYVMYGIITCALAVIIYYDRVYTIRTQKKSEELTLHLSDMSFHDALTGLLNRHALDVKLNPTAGKMYYVAMADVNEFKQFNDTYGHQTGDAVLAETAKYLLRHFRKTDCYRYGGDEFLIISENIGRDAFIKRIREWKNDVKQIEISEDEIHGVEISCGIYDGTAVNKDELFELIKNADDRLYRIKKGMTDGVSDEENMSEQVADAMSKGQIVAFYQPKVDVRDNKIIGAEALVRWKMDDGIVPPGSFLPVLEETGDICGLDKYLFNRVCSEVRGWMDKGLTVPCISCNFSMKHLTNENFVDELIEIAEKNGAPHDHLEIEMTETVDPEATSRLLDVIQRLRQAGFRTAMDDFGSGYSSLSLLKDIPVDVVKLDRSLLVSYKDFTKVDDHSRALIKHVIGLVKDMGMMCLAEGVESVQQKNFLRDVGCNYVQGFLYDRPLEADVFEQRITVGSYEDPEEEQIQEKETQEEKTHSFDLHVLLAEDNEINREITVNILESMGVKVTTAVDGFDALEAFKAAEEDSIDGILMDIQMPIMDGYESTQAIRALERSDATEVPIIAITVDAYKETRKRAEDAGMSGYVTKPLDPARLLDLLNSMEEMKTGGATRR